MKFVYTGHFIFQIKERRITKKLAQEIYLSPEENYIDSVSNHFIAISKVKLGKKFRKIMIAYDIIGNEVHFVTSYPVGDKEIAKRVERKRWIYEKN